MRLQELVDPAAAQPDRHPPQAITSSTGSRKRGGLESLTNPNTVSLCNAPL